MKHETKSMSADWHESEESHDYDRMEHVINVGDTERVISGIAGGYLLYRGLSGIGEHPVGGLLKTLIGGFLLYRGASGTCPVYTALGKTEGVNRTKALTVRSSIVVERPREEVYAFWRKLENLPLFMKHLIRVQEHDDIRSTWSADLPGFGRLLWDAEIVKDIPGFFIGWVSAEEAPMENAGKVEFMDAGPGRTQVKVVITYRPPAGDLGVAIASALNPAFKKVVQEEIAGFKERIENVVW
jgi:uncharacterized membrane protein